MDYRPHYPAPLRLLSGAVDIALVLGGGLIVLLVFTNAFLRGAAGFDLAWSLEITAFLILWTTFLGCSAAMARGAHMRVTEIVESLLPIKAQRVLSIANDLIIVVMLISLIWNGYSISAHTWAQKTTVLYWPVGFLYASMPFGMALSLIFHLFNLYQDLRYPQGPDDHQEPHTMTDLMRRTVCDPNIRCRCLFDDSFPGHSIGLVTSATSTSLSRRWTF